MTTIAQYAAAHDMQPYEVAAYLSLGRDYSDQDELTAEEIAMLTIPADITDQLDGWGIDYLFDAEGVNVGDVHIEMDGADFVVKEGGDVIAITSDPDRQRLCWPSRSPERRGLWAIPGTLMSTSPAQK